MTMFDITGRYASARIFTDLVEPAAIAQLIQMLNQPFAENQQIRLMPDIHPGAGCVIGTTMTIQDKVCPNLVGVDIGCGMLAIQIRETSMDFAELDDLLIRGIIPSGRNIREQASDLIQHCQLDQLRCKRSSPLDAMYLGTLGGGNHFIEIDKDGQNSLWIIIHTGSRRLGIRVADYYQKQAIRDLHTPSKQQINDLRRRLQSDNKLTDQLFKQEYNQLQPKYNHIPDDLCWCEGQLLDDYLHDMEIVQNYAEQNRQLIADTILQELHLTAVDSFSTIHNYIDLQANILRKGAVSAQKGERLLIPINMRDGCLLCTGKGNAEWNYSAPHGAGRLLSRSAAKTSLTVTEFQQTMQGIWSSTISQATLDESPMAYKPMDQILNNIQETVTVNDILKPVYNFKAGE